ncbi:hypothetical protein M3Y97_01070200 [Aphelenchoides bicaudatus]|nr:hypothetical protein M3Y97_01070200 [Aphelenchoides bicaudatus]
MEKFRSSVKNELKLRFVDLLRQQTPNGFVEYLREEFLPPSLVIALARLTDDESSIYLDYVVKYQGKFSYLTDERAKEMLTQMRYAHPQIYKIMAPAIVDCAKRCQKLNDGGRKFYDFYIQESSDIDWESNKELKNFFQLVLSKWTQLDEADRNSVSKYFPNIPKLLNDRRLYKWTGFIKE